jgi:large subunit ribosomal protein L4
VLVVAAADDELTWKSLRNVRGVHLLAAGQLNTYDVLVSDHVVFTEAALDQFVTRSGFAPAEPEDAVEPADAEPEDSVESPEPEDAAS